MPYQFRLRTNPSPRRLALIGALLLTALLLAACQQADATALPAEITPAGGTPPVATIPTATLTATATTVQPTPTPDGLLGVDPESLKGRVVNFWHPWHGELEERALEAARAFNQANPWGLRVQVRALYSDGSLFEALSEALEPGAGEVERPDVIAAPGEQLAFWAQGSTPAVVDLTRYVVDGQAGLGETEIAAFYQSFWAQDTSGSTRYGLPALRDARVLFYNQSWAEELGFDGPPDTPADFKAQACAAAEVNNAARLVDLYGTGGWLVDTDALTTLSWLNAFGANPLPETEGQPYRFQSPEAEEALEFLRGMVSDGCAWVARSASPYEHFARRKALFYSGSLADLQIQAGWQTQMQSSDRWTILPFPSAEGEPVVFSAGYSYGVLSGTPEAQLGGWLFARWLAQPENAARLAEVMPSLPVSRPVAEQLGRLRGNIPWEQVVPLAESARPAPGLASWRAARRLVEDAAWQVYHLPPEELAQVLPYLDETVREILTD